ncbi:helix-turn-helix domain-containing protein [Vagococcus xieshaowenii]|nr:helix-turn-helix domain-containing protein [Vagococcus xieshaowenii]
MKTEVLMENDDRFKILILQYLELNKQGYVHISKLYELTGLSKFKMENLLKELMEDLLLLEENPKLYINDEGVIEIKKINLSIIKKIKLKYLEHSLTFKMLDDLVVRQSSVDKFSKDNHLSRSQLYIKRKELKKFLSSYDIKLKGNKILGDETRVRNALCIIYFDIYNGIKFPFSDEIYNIVNRLVIHYEQWFKFNLTYVDRVKLGIVIAVSIIRVKNNHHNNIKFFESDDLLDFFSLQISMLSDYLPVKSNILIYEVEYILVYIVLNFEGDSIKKNYSKIQTSFFNDVDEFSQNTINKIVSNVEKISDMHYEEKKLFIEEIYKNNRRKYLFDIERTNIKSKRFFEETYPEISNIVSESIDDELSKGKYDFKFLSNHLFYDYILILFSLFSITSLEKTIHVCVDFTMGRHYNQFIINQVVGFRHFNIKIEDKLTNKTDIYISDCIIENIEIIQIIWKSPPTSDDWEDFGNKVIEVKNL